MKPMMILTPGTMSDGDIAELRANNICVVVSKDPAAVRFVDPLPVQSSRTEIEIAAIKFSRKVLANNFWNPEWSGAKDARATLVSKFIEILSVGSPLDPNPSQQELEKKAYNEAKIEEQRRIAREDARAEREAKKKAAAMPKRDDKGHFVPAPKESAK